MELQSKPGILGIVFCVFSCSQMEVPVIENPQARICRAEVPYRVNRFSIGSEFISITARNRVTFYGETTRRNEIRLCCSQSSIRCKAVVSDNAPFLKSIPRARLLDRSRQWRS